MATSDWAPRKHPSRWGHLSWDQVDEKGPVIRKFEGRRLPGRGSKYIGRWLRRRLNVFENREKVRVIGARWVKGRVVGQSGEVGRSHIMKSFRPRWRSSVNPALKDEGGGLRGRLLWRRWWEGSPHSHSRWRWGSLELLFCTLISCLNNGGVWPQSYEILNRNIGKK